MNSIFLVSAPSGSGKTSIMRMTSGREIISFTTRVPRKNETHAIDYYFVSKEQLIQLEKKNCFVQRFSFGEYEYGITREEVKKKCQLGAAYAIVSVDGMKQLKNLYPESITIFIDTSLSDCIENMRDRGDSEETIQKRIQAYHLERSFMHLYDYIVVNQRGNIFFAVSEIQKIIQLERKPV